MNVSKLALRYLNRVVRAGLLGSPQELHLPYRTYEMYDLRSPSDRGLVDDSMYQYKPTPGHQHSSMLSENGQGYMT